MTEEELSGLKETVNAPTCALTNSRPQAFDPLNVKLDGDARRKIAAELNKIPDHLYMPSSFTPPLRGNRIKSTQDASLFHLMNDMKLLYKSVFSAIFECMKGNQAMCEGVLTQAALPLSAHCLSAINTERIALRHNREMVKELSGQPFEPLLRPAQIQRAKSLAKEKDSFKKLEEIFHRGSRNERPKSSRPSFGSQYRKPFRGKPFRKKFPFKGNNKSSSSPIPKQKKVP
jgi:hypothetical protein